LTIRISVCNEGNGFVKDCSGGKEALIGVVLEGNQSTWSQVNIDSILDIKVDHSVVSSNELTHIRHIDPGSLSAREVALESITLSGIRNNGRH